MMIKNRQTHKLSSYQCHSLTVSQTHAKAQAHTRGGGGGGGAVQNSPLGSDFFSSLTGLLVREVSHVRWYPYPMYGRFFSEETPPPNFFRPGAASRPATNDDINRTLGYQIKICQFVKLFILFLKQEVWSNSFWTFYCALYKDILHF